MASRFPSVGFLTRELALTMVGRMSPALEIDLRARFDSRQEYARTPSPQRETLALANRANHGGNRRAPSSTLFTVFIIFFAQCYMAMAGQALLLLSGLGRPTIYEFLLVFFSAPVLDFRVVLPTRHHHEVHHRPPFSALTHFLLIFARSYLSMRGKVLRIMPSAQPRLFRALLAPVLPWIPLDTSHMTVTSESAPLDKRFHDTSTSKEEARVLRDLAKMYEKLQGILGAGCSMTPNDAAKTASALVAGSFATLRRTCGLPLGKVKALLAPVTEVTTALLRRKTGSHTMSEAKQAYVLGVLSKRVDDMEELLQHALWTRNWPAIPAELATIGNRFSSKMGTTANKTAAVSGVHCVRRRNASATIDPRASHLRGSGAVVSK